MKAQVLYDIGNLQYTDVDMPSVRDDEALVKVTACGICGSDIPRIYKTGAHNMPLIPGHEMTGIVQSCSNDPELIGRKVGIFPLIPCKKCAQCRKGHYEMCSDYNYLGSRCDGGFAEYVSVPVWNLMPLPDSIPFEVAAMLEPMCVAIHAIKTIGLIDYDDHKDISENKFNTTSNNISQNDLPHIPDTSIDKAADPHIVICGLGTIGLFVAMFLKNAGYSNVYCIGNKDIQRSKLLELGYCEDDFCDIRITDPYKFIKGRTDDAGADYYFECIGRSDNYEQTVRCSAPLGKIMLVGNPASDMNLPRDIYWKILRNQLTLKGTWNSSYPDDWTYAIHRLTAFYDRDKGSMQGDKSFLIMPPSSLITHRFPLDSINKGLSIMKDKSEEYIKVMITL